LIATAANVKLSRFRVNGI